MLEENNSGVLPLRSPLVELSRLDGPSLSNPNFSSAGVVSSRSSAIFSSDKTARNTPQLVALGLGAVNAAALWISGEFMVIRILAGECAASDPPEKYDIS